MAFGIRNYALSTVMLKVLISCVALVFLGCAMPFSALACGFNEDLTGVCPVSELDDPANLAAGEERAVLDSRYLWTNYSSFKNSKSILLQVCLFRQGAGVVTTTPSKVLSFKNDAQRFEKIGKKIENAANEWTSFSLQASDGIWVSKVNFNFRDASGNIQACEDLDSWHVAVVINDNRQNYSTVGFSGLKASKTESKGMMTLYQDVASDVITHEFGHILGFLHEMAHKSWIKCAESFDAVDYVKSSGYHFSARSKAETKEEYIAREAVTARYNISDMAKRYLNVSVGSERFDRGSIMTYAIADRYFDPKVNDVYKCGMPNITKISKDDMKEYLKAYHIVK